MPCSAAVHVHGRPFIPDSRLSWKPGNIVIVRKKSWKWTPKEKRFYQIIIIPFWTEREGLKWQGRQAAVVDLAAIHANEGQRAAMRNPDIVSPVPTRLTEARIAKGKNWDNPMALAEIR